MLKDYGRLSVYLPGAGGPSFYSNQYESVIASIVAIG